MLNWRIVKGIRVDRALAEIEAQPDLWKIFTARQEFPGSAHRDTECIVLRGPREFNLETIFDDLDMVNEASTQSRMPWTVNLIRAIFLNYLPGYQLGRIMVVKLRPGGHIKKHWDSGAYAAHYERFHLVLTSAAGNFIKTWATRPASFIAPFPGELIKFPHLADHEVWNLSDEPRIHIIIDARKNDAQNHLDA